MLVNIFSGREIVHSLTKNGLEHIDMHDVEIYKYKSSFLFLFLSLSFILCSFSVLAFAYIKHIEIGQRLIRKKNNKLKKKSWLSSNIADALKLIRSMP